MRSLVGAGDCTPLHRQRVLYPPSLWGAVVCCHLSRLLAQKDPDAHKRGALPSTHRTRSWDPGVRPPVEVVAVPWRGSPSDVGTRGSGSAKA
eukprot:2880862-Rhodomonas_salina.1